MGRGVTRLAGDGGGEEGAGLCLSALAFAKTCPLSLCRDCPLHLKVDAASWERLRDSLGSALAQAGPHPSTTHLRGLWGVV